MFSFIFFECCIALYWSLMMYNTEDKEFNPQINCFFVDFIGNSIMKNKNIISVEVFKNYKIQKVTGQNLMDSSSCALSYSDISKHNSQ